jgi:hypothetical protein
MTLATFFTRLHVAILVLFGRVKLPNVPLKEMELAMALEQLNAVVAVASAAADRLIANAAAAATAAADAEAALANAQADAAAFDAAAAAVVQPLADKLAEAAPEAAPEQPSA